MLVLLQRCTRASCLWKSVRRRRRFSTTEILRRRSDTDAANLWHHQTEEAPSDPSSSHPQHQQHSEEKKKEKNSLVVEEQTSPLFLFRLALFDGREVAREVPARTPSQPYVGHRYWRAFDYFWLNHPNLRSSMTSPDWETLLMLTMSTESSDKRKRIEIVRQRMRSVGLRLATKTLDQIAYGVRRRHFQSMELDGSRPSALTYATLIYALSSHNLTGKYAQILLNRALRRSPDVFDGALFAAAIKSCVTDELELVKNYTDMAESMGFGRTVEVRIAIMHFHSRLVSITFDTGGDPIHYFQTVQRLHDELLPVLKPESREWMRVEQWYIRALCGYHKLQEVKQRIKVLRETGEGAPCHDSFVTAAVIILACQLGDLEFALEVRAWAASWNVRMGSLVINALMDAHMRRGESEAALAIFNGACRWVTDDNAWQKEDEDVRRALHDRLPEMDNARQVGSLAFAKAIGLCADAGDLEMARRLVHVTSLVGLGGRKEIVDARVKLLELKRSKRTAEDEKEMIIKR